MIDTASRDASVQASTARPLADHRPALLRERRFAPFFWTQFLGAMNDNTFKIGFTSLATYQAARFGGIDAQHAAFAISAIFILPFLLFSATAGQLADKLERASLTRWIKTFEIAIMLIGSAGFLLHAPALLYLGVFLMGMHSTIFGPVKYAYLPQHLRPLELVHGNGLVEMATFVAILLGTILGGEAAALPGGEFVLALLCVGTAILGRVTAAGVPLSPAPAPGLQMNWNPFSETGRNLREAGHNRIVLIGLIGISWLWFVGATYLASFFSFARDVLGADQNVVTLLLAMFSLGIGAGSMICARLANGPLTLGLVPFGAVGITVFSADLYFACHAHAQAPGDALLALGPFLHVAWHWRVLADLFLLAGAGGIYSVPLYTLIQRRARETHRARIIAANNILNSLFMIASSLMAIGLFAAGLSIPGLFLVVAGLNALMLILLLSTAPLFKRRALVWSRRLWARRLTTRVAR